jgi:hypothetical protein
MVTECELGYQVAKGWRLIPLQNPCCELLQKDESVDTWLSSYVAYTLSVDAQSNKMMKVAA